MHGGENNTESGSLARRASRLGDFAPVFAGRLAKESPRNRSHQTRGGNSGCFNALTDLLRAFGLWIFLTRNRDSIHRVWGSGPQWCVGHETLKSLRGVVALAGFGRRRPKNPWSSPRIFLYRPHYPRTTLQREKFLFCPPHYLTFDSRFPQSSQQQNSAYDIDSRQNVKQVD